MTTSWERTVGAIGLAGALVLAGCSSDGPNDAGGPTTTAAVTDSDATTTTVGADGDVASGPLEAYADYESVNYDDPTHWVCRPDLEDPCDGNLDTTVIQADGSTSVEPFEADPDAPIDCFYVYPTISRDETPYSDWEASAEEEGFVTVQQAARLGSECRVFAPVYRQGTLSALTSRLNGEDGNGEQEVGDPYADVLDAFRTYMAQDNSGRGYVLIGHSQGSALLTRLLAEEVDPNEEVRSLLVSAYLAGSSVSVPDGELVGGDFQNIPLCQTDDEVGCAVTWASFRSTAPPPAGSFFGRPREGEGVAGCVNPASIAGGNVELHGYFPADRTSSILASLGAGGDRGSWVDGVSAPPDTPFVSLPGLLTGACVETDQFNYLSVEVHPDPGPRHDDISGDLTPEWGLHLVDVNLVMGDIVDRVRQQSESFQG